MPGATETEKEREKGKENEKGSESEKESSVNASENEIENGSVSASGNVNESERTEIGSTEAGADLGWIEAVAVAGARIGAAERSAMMLTASRAVSARAKRRERARPAEESRLSLLWGRLLDQYL